MTGETQVIPDKIRFIETILRGRSVPCMVSGGLAQTRCPTTEKDADFLALDLDEYLTQLAGEWYEGQSMPPDCRPTGGTAGRSAA
jgi:hypothetical protein